MIGLASSFQFISALAFVLGLIGFAAFAARRLGFANRTRLRGPRRLAITEVMAIDARRRLVLIRRDGVEHLILLGAQSETVIETSIGPSPTFASTLAEARPLTTAVTVKGSTEAETAHSRQS